MMKEKIRKIYEQAFGEDRDWNRWYFEHVYAEEEGMLLVKGGNAVSTLQLQRYAFRYMGGELGLGYISGAATAREARGKGYMTELMNMALREAYGRGYAFAALIPATARLWGFYEKFGFGKVVFLDRERYTEVHTFSMSEDYEVCEPDYASFRRLTEQRNATVVQSERQYENILWDTAHEGGTVKAVRDVKSGETAAMAFATCGREGVTVRELVSENAEAAEAVLHEIQAAMPKKPMTVWAAPQGRVTALTGRGMMRVVNVKEVLGALAARHPRTEQVIRVHDGQIAENNGVYILRDGKCEQTDATMRRLTLDVSIEVLTKILFSSERTGEIFGIASGHPMLPLMLD